MLNRRYIRIKVMQALYAFFQSADKDLAKSEKVLFSEIDKIYDLYIYQLALILEIRHIAQNITEDAKNKRVPSQSDLNPNLKFIQNKFIEQLDQNIHLKREIHNRKISWNNDYELVKKILNKVKSGELYQKHMDSSTDSYAEDRDFIVDMFKEHIADYELANHFYEEKNLYWGDDLYLVNPMIVKTLESFNESSSPEYLLMSLYKDEQDDKEFAKELFRQTVIQEVDTKKLIAEKTKNWEVDRIALMDILIMKMAITELTYFNNIPVKASLNEYIEISKLYSTPKSKVFINGILDKLIVDLKLEGKIAKTGRGLME